jgi:hypothetical protein
LEMRWLHGQKVFCACFLLFFWCIWSQKCPEIICNFMQNSSGGLTRSQAYQRLFPCMRQLWNWALHGLNNDEQWSPSNTCGAKSSINTIIHLCKWDYNALYSGSCPKSLDIKTALGLTLLHEHLSLSLLFWCVSKLAEGRKKGRRRGLRAICLRLSKCCIVGSCCSVQFLNKNRILTNQSFIMHIVLIDHVCTVKIQVE